MASLLFQTTNEAVAVTTTTIEPAAVNSANLGKFYINLQLESVSGSAQVEVDAPLNENGFASLPLLADAIVLCLSKVSAIVNSKHTFAIRFPHGSLYLL